MERAAILEAEAKQKSYLFIIFVGLFIILDNFISNRKVIFPNGYQPEHYISNRNAIFSNRVSTGPRHFEPEGNFPNRITTGIVHFEPECHIFESGINRTISLQTGMPYFQTGYQPEHSTSNRNAIFSNRMTTGIVYLKPECQIFESGINRKTSLQTGK
jgi:hypothetical protein